MDDYDYSYLKGIRIEQNLMQSMERVVRTQERCRMWMRQYPAEFSELEKRTSIDAVFYSHTIEHMVSKRKEVDPLLKGKRKQETEKDLKIVSYAKARALALASAAENRPFTTDLVLEIHMALMGGYDDLAGDFRQRDTYHPGRGTMSAIRKPMKPSLIKENFSRFCISAENALRDPEYNIMYLVPTIIMDFLQISPFEHGNGRVYRILMEYLFLRKGMDILRYVSLDRQFFLNDKDHISAMYKTDLRQQEGFRDASLFIEDTISNLERASSDLNIMFPPPWEDKMNKSQRVRRVIGMQEWEFERSDLDYYLPGVSANLIQQELSAMVAEGSLQHMGITKNSRYVKCPD